MNTSNIPRTSSMLTRNHWIFAAILAVLICGIGVRPCLSGIRTDWIEDLTPNDKTLLELCESSATTPEDIKAILKVGARIEATGFLGTPLALAAMHNPNPEVIEVLLKAGADIKRQGAGVGRAPLQRAVMSNPNPKVIEVLKKYGAEWSDDDLARDFNLTLLHSAARSNSSRKVIDYLIKTGEHIEARDFLTKTPLMKAAESNSNIEVIEALLKAGADIEAITTYLTFVSTGKNLVARTKGKGWGRTPLMLAASSNANPMAIKTLLKYGADITARSENGWTPLMWAARGNSDPDLRWDSLGTSKPEVIEALLKGGADIEARSKNGETPLMIAAMHNSNPEVIETLLKGGADIAGRHHENGATPLMFAAVANSNPEVIEALLKAGANAKAKDQEGKTAADYAKDNKKIYKTKVYWKLNELQYE